MTSSTNAKQVAILVEKNFEDSEFQVPYTALQKAGVQVTVLGSRMNEEYKGKKGKVSIKPDATATEVRAEDFDAVIIPGGAAPDRMRVNPNMVRLIQDAVAQGKLVAAVCHGPQVLIEGDLLKSRRATGYRSIRKDMENAGAIYVNEPLVVDANLITSRQPGDLPIFTTAILNHLGLSIAGTVLPKETELTAEWWKLGEIWDGSSKSQIAEGLNTALAGERYGREAFEQYAEKASDPELRSLLQEMIENKQSHIEALEARLNAIGESPSLPASAADVYATFKTRLQPTSDDLEILLRVLGDLQTGVVDTYNLRNQFTDPATTALLDAIETELAQYEQRVAELYRARAGKVEPAQPSTGAAV
jgi:protease I